MGAGSPKAGWLLQKPWYNIMAGCTQKKSNGYWIPPPGLPSAISITSLPICSRPPFYFIQFSWEIRHSRVPVPMSPIERLHWLMGSVRFSLLSWRLRSCCEAWLLHGFMPGNQMKRQWSPLCLWKTTILPLTVSQFNVLQCSEIWPVQICSV